MENNCRKSPPHLPKLRFRNIPPFALSNAFCRRTAQHGLIRRYSDSMIWNSGYWSSKRQVGSKVSRMWSLEMRVLVLVGRRVNYFEPGCVVGYWPTFRQASFGCRQERFPGSRDRRGQKGRRSEATLASRIYQSVAASKFPHAHLTIWYCSTDRLCRCGDAVKYRYGSRMPVRV